MNYAKLFKAASGLGRFVGESISTTYTGFGIKEARAQSRKYSASDRQLAEECRTGKARAEAVLQKLAAAGFKTDDDVCSWALGIVDDALFLISGDAPSSGVLTGALKDQLVTVMAELCRAEDWFFIPPLSDTVTSRSELWAWEDQVKRVSAFLDHHAAARSLLVRYLASLALPLVKAHPSLLDDSAASPSSIAFETDISRLLKDVPGEVERMLVVTFSPEIEALGLFEATRKRLDYNLQRASGIAPNAANATNKRQLKLPSQNKQVQPQDMPKAYLNGSPLEGLFTLKVPIVMPEATRFEHMHMVAGSGHGKTQTLQHLILRDLEKVAAGEASVIVMDSQSDLINTIAGLQAFAPGGPLADRLVHIDPTDIEWPVALNLFDAGLERLDQYGPLERERLTNSILELYDFVLGSLLDAGMTQKQTVIFRYITRLLLHIPGATIHTLRELLEDGGSVKYQTHIDKLEGSARTFFDTEFNGKEFVATKRQVVRRLYGILENQTFERMFTHPKSKLDLFSEMNAGKVILINTAKDLLKENGTEIFGRFFIALIAQAAQERAVLPKSERLPAYVYVDEASDYFDKNVGIILSQARKYNVGMILAHQFLGQLEPRLHDAIAANTAIKFAGGVSAKDARALSNDLRTDAGFIESQEKFHFAAFIKGQTQRAVGISNTPGQMEGLPRLTTSQKTVQRATMRSRYAIHHSKLKPAPDPTSEPEEDNNAPETGQTQGEEEGRVPMPWPEPKA